MNIKNRIIKTLGLTALVVGLLVGNSFAQTTAGQRINATYFGMHSLASGQTLRLTVVNSLFDGAMSDPDTRVRIIFNIYEANPTVSVRLRLVRRVSYEVLLDAGEAASFDFPATRTGESVSISTFASPEDTTNRAEEAAISTLEVMTGPRTVFTLPGIIKSLNLQSNPS